MGESDLMRVLIIVIHVDSASRGRPEFCFLLRSGLMVNVQKKYYILTKPPILWCDVRKFVGASVISATKKKIIIICRIFDLENAMYGWVAISNSGNEVSEFSTFNLIYFVKTFLLHCRAYNSVQHTRIVVYQIPGLTTYSYSLQSTPYTSSTFHILYAQHSTINAQTTFHTENVIKKNPNINATYFTFLSEYWILNRIQHSGAQWNVVDV